MIFTKTKEVGMADAQVKCVMVGDSAVGKTYMALAFVKGVCPCEDIPTVFDTYTTEVLVEEYNIQLNLWETSGSDYYDRLRALSYSLTDVVLMCFSLASEASFENVEHKWYPEIKHHLPKTPIVLVGTQLDIRNSGSSDRHERPCITTPQGKALMKQIGAVKYLECSAKTGEGVNAVFEEAADATRVVKYEEDVPLYSRITSSTRDSL